MNAFEDESWLNRAIVLNHIRRSTSSKPTDYIEDPAGTRRCALCLKVCGLPIKLCVGCKKRAYCSVECQAKDWSVTETGQRHENWCQRYECGEEDVDFQIVPIAPKGLGVRAKRLLPAGFRIIVEPVYTSPNDHPEIAKLEPIRGSLVAKFELNKLMGDLSREGGRDYVGLRISRVNHDCRPNAAHVYDVNARVQILYALRDIQEGEEICFSYSLFPNLFLGNTLKSQLSPSTDEFKFLQRVLYTNWGFQCPDNCFCKDPIARKLVVDGKELDTRMDIYVRRGRIEEALEAGDKLLEIQRKLNVSWTYRAEMELQLFKIAVRSSKTMAKGNEHIKAALEIGRVVCPYSEVTKKYEKFANHPETV